MSASRRNRDLAAGARASAAACPDGSPGRKAWLTAGVALDTTASVPAARRVLGEMTAGDLQAHALAVLGELCGSPAGD